MKRVVGLFLAAGLLAACAGATPTPIIVYVTPVPSPIAAPVTPVPSPTLIATSAPTPSASASLVAIAATPTPTAAPTPNPTRTPKPTATAKPWDAGYDDYGDGLAFRWLKNPEFSCPYDGSSCWAAYVIARDGCPSGLYMELSVEDAGGTVIGMTNDSLGSVAPLQRGKLVFSTFDLSAAKAHVSDLRCY